ncbi:MAG: biotin/lipoate A/B protein ligase family protein [Halodesulfurarchaeum sp.]
MTSMPWQIVNEGRYTEAMHHALDEVLLDRLAEGALAPTLRFWYRETPAIPLGRFQAFEDEVAVDFVEAHSIPVVRRITGGGAMYVEPGNVITYSMYLPRDAVPADVEESYEALDQWVIDALSRVDLDVRHEPLNDLVHPAGKIGGSAQLRTRDAVLHHTTMSYDLDIESMLRVLRIGDEKVSDKAVSSAEKRVAVMREHIDASREEVIDALVASFEDVYGGSTASLDDDILDTARDLAASKFSSPEWNRKL